MSKIKLYYNNEPQIGLPATYNPVVEGSKWILKKKIQDLSGCIPTGGSGTDGDARELASDGSLEVYKVNFPGGFEYESGTQNGSNYDRTKIDRSSVGAFDTGGFRMDAELQYNSFDDEFIQVARVGTTPKLFKINPATLAVSLDAVTTDGSVHVHGAAVAGTQAVMQRAGTNYLVGACFLNSSPSTRAFYILNLSTMASKAVAPAGGIAGNGAATALADGQYLMVRQRDIDKTIMSKFDPDAETGVLIDFDNAGVGAAGLASTILAFNPVEIPGHADKVAYILRKESVAFGPVHDYLVVNDANTGALLDSYDLGSIAHKGLLATGSGELVWMTGNPSSRRNIKLSFDGASLSVVGDETEVLHTSTASRDGYVHNSDNNYIASLSWRSTSPPGAFPREAITIWDSSGANDLKQSALVIDTEFFSDLVLLPQLQMDELRTSVFIPADSRDENPIPVSVLIQDTDSTVKPNNHMINTEDNKGQGSAQGQYDLIAVHSLPAGSMPVACILDDPGTVLEYERQD